MSATDITGRLARYMAEARQRTLAPDVAREARHRILDSLAAMVSGAHLKPGEMAIKYARSQGGIAEATVVATDIRTSAINAALANAMFGHADETDDFHPETKAHPGCSVVPAALAMAEREGIDPALALAILSGSAASSWMLKNRGPRMVENTGQVASALDIFVKDLGIVLEAGRSLKMGLPLAAAAHQLFIAASGLGLGGRDDSQLIELYRSLQPK